MPRGDKGTSAGGRHGSHDTHDDPSQGTNANRKGADQPRDTAAVSGLQHNTGEFRVGEKIIFGMRNGDILIRRSPQGEEVTVSEATLAGLMVDAFFGDKFGEDYPTTSRQ